MCVLRTFSVKYSFFFLFWESSVKYAREESVNVFWTKLTILNVEGLNCNLFVIFLSLVHYSTNAYT